MEKGQQHKVVVQSLANSGDGVGRIEEKVIFIPFAVPGDHLLVEIVENKKSFSKGKILDILQNSEHRREAPCVYFGECGGCHWQNMSEDYQLEWKVKNLKDVLSRIGGFEEMPFLQKAIASPRLLEYRNRIQLHGDKKGYFYFQRGQKKPVYIEQCLLANQKINLWLKNNPKPKQKAKIELALMDDGSLQTFKVNNKGQSELGFRQVNDRQNQWIQNQMARWIEEFDCKTLVDLYCGQGNWCLALEKKIQGLKWLGIDNNSVNIANAQTLSQAPENFILGDACEEYLKTKGTTDLVIVDPPRAGCDEKLLEDLNKNPPNFLCYISCHPATMARDLKLLVQKNWKVQELTPVDMFPQTPHLECLVLLQSNKGAKTANY